MRVKFIDARDGQGYIEVGKDYYATPTSIDHYTINGVCWRQNRFIQIANEDPNKLLEVRIEQLEAKVRQLQDQLDHHDHKTPIDFTVEIEHK